MLRGVTAYIGMVAALAGFKVLGRRVSSPARPRIDPREEKAERIFRFEAESIILEVRRDKAMARMEVPYDQVYAVYEDGSCFYILTSPVAGMIVPKKDVGQERLEDFRSFISHATGEPVTSIG